MAAVEWIMPLSDPYPHDAPQPLFGGDWLVRRTRDGNYFCVVEYVRRQTQNSAEKTVVLVFLSTEWGTCESEPLISVPVGQISGKDDRERVEAAIERIGVEQIHAQELKDGREVRNFTPTKVALWVGAACLLLACSLPALRIVSAMADQLPRHGASPCEAGEVVPVDRQVTIHDRGRDVSLDPGTYTVKAVDKPRWVPERLRLANVTLRRDAPQVIDEVTVSERSLQNAGLC